MSNNRLDKTEPNQTKQTPFISEVNFQLLREAQQRLSIETGFSPQISKLINLIISEERIHEAEEHYKDKFNDLGNF